MDSLITFDKLAYTYPDGTSALKDVNCSIELGLHIGVIGANGAGKTTFVNHCNGCLLGSEGSVYIKGIKVWKKTIQEIRKITGTVFQNTDDQLFMTSLYDDVAFGPQNMGLPTDEVNKRVEDVLKYLHLWEYRHKPPYHLSQGQKRFAAIATVLSMAPEIIIMDEPTSDLDSGNRRKLIHLLCSLSATFLIVSHDLDFIWDTCQEVIVFNKGSIVSRGPVKEILSSEELLYSCGLELPLRLQAMTNDE